VVYPSIKINERFNRWRRIQRIGWSINNYFSLNLQQTSDWLPATAPVLIIILCRQLHAVASCVMLWTVVIPSGNRSAAVDETENFSFVNFTFLHAIIQNCIYITVKISTLNHVIRTTNFITTKCRILWMLMGRSFESMSDSKAVGPIASCAKLSAGWAHPKPCTSRCLQRLILWQATRWRRLL
jgi:hypothetical protein